MIRLPFPPSVNRTRKVDRANRKLATWKRNAGKELLLQPVMPIVEPYHLDITLERPDKRRRDLDNFLKPILDLLQEHGVTPDDSQCQGITVRWADSVSGPVVLVKAA